MSYESVTISIEPERKNLSKIDIDPISQCQSILNETYGKYLFSSLKQEQKIILDHKTHPVFEGFLSSYQDHRPITISPDIIWLLIVQAFSNHISTNPEKFRHMFVNFEGKQLLTVERSINFYIMTIDDWLEIFPEFVKQISDYTGKEITDILSPDFTTTTPISRSVGQLTIMSTMKHYFEYKVIVSGCGFPYITIEGSISDWEKIHRKLNALAKYKFNWFTKRTIPIIKEIIETKKGNVNKAFWKQILRIKDSSGYYNPTLVDGWFTSFFPFAKNGDRLTAPISIDQALQPEMQEIPFELEIRGERTLRCLFLAGFVGLSQCEGNMSIKPEIGWFIKLEDLRESTSEIMERCHSNNRRSIDQTVKELLDLAERHKSDPFYEKVMKKCDVLRKMAESLYYEESDDDGASDADEDEDLADEKEIVVDESEADNQEDKIDVDSSNQQSTKTKRKSNCCLLI